MNLLREMMVIIQRLIHRIMTQLFDEKLRDIILNTLRVAVLIVSFILIALISLDAFNTGVQFLKNDLYMKLQVPICILFLTDFFVALAFSPDRKGYLKRNWLFFLVSIPYTALIHALGLHVDGTWGYILHFVPTLRATLAVAIVIGFVSTNKVIGLFASYLAIMVIAIYFSSIIFFLYEGNGVNPGVTSYWSALWWCSLEATTLGAPYYAVTFIGKVLAILMSGMGILLFPLFTVYLTQIVRRYIGKTATAEQ